jgi:hypothetical protein
MLGHLASPLPAAQRAHNIVSRKGYRSPDRTLIANVVFLKQRIYGDPPSRVEIHRANRRLLAQTDYSSSDGQGFTIRKAAWTADSRFFVYIAESSGGHGPWHHPIFFYSRKRHRFYSLDRALAALRHGDGAITGYLELRSPCTVVTKGRYDGKSKAGLHTSIEAGDASGDKVLEIDLSRLEPRLNSSMEDSHSPM